MKTRKFSGTVLASLTGLVLLGSPAQGQTPPKIAFVNFAQALQETAEVKARVVEIQAFVSEKNQESDNRLDAINALRARLNEGSAENPQQAQRELQRLEVDFQRFQEDTQAAITTRRNTLFQQHTPKMQIVIRELAEAGNYDVIFAIDPDIVYIDPSLDLTEQATARYDSKHPVAG